MSDKPLSRIACEYFEQGYTYDLVLSLCQAHNRHRTDPLDDKNIEAAVAGAYDYFCRAETNGTNGTKETNETTRDKRDKRGQSGTVQGQMGQRFPGDMRAAVDEFLQGRQGFFFDQDVDRELGLVDRQDKKNRSRVLKEKENIKEIRRDRRDSKKWHILRTEIEFIDLDQTEEEHFPISLPLGLTPPLKNPPPEEEERCAGMVRLPPKCVVVVAGTSNAGKTAFLLETLKRNLNADYPLMYLMSEMGPSEYKQRVRKIVDDDEQEQFWKSKIKAASMSSGFDGAITQYNPNGLTVIDFLEEIDGQYYLLASDIRAIYDALDTGIAIIALQKHSQAEVGQGGEGTTQKARLYITLDKLAHRPRSTISALKIHKAKDYPGNNPNNLERHVEIRAGSNITPLTDWMYCNKKQREQYIARYEHMIEQGMDVMPEGKMQVVIRFPLEDGSYGNLRRKDYEKWAQSYTNIDVYSQLEGIAKWAKNGGKLSKKGWFFQVSNMLKKKNNESSALSDIPWDQ